MSATDTTLDPERRRLDEDLKRTKNWKRWGPYLSDRQWGTVREDYSPNGAAWDSFPHAHARSRAYRWGEDGLMGISDRHQYVCFALALWNGEDSILKERLFGLTGPEGNHGEDVKECYYYLDSTPTHSYMKALYKYPQRAFPYDWLLAENRSRTRQDPEFELVDTGIFDDDRYFDVFTEYAKAAPDDVLIRIRVHNRGPEEAVLHLLPTIWFRNVWSWGLGTRRQRVRAGETHASHTTIDLDSEYYGRLALQCEGEPRLLFTENESNARLLWGTENESSHVKDGFHDFVIHGNEDAVNTAGVGSKGAARYLLTIPGGGSAVVRLRLSGDTASGTPFGPEFDAVFEARIREANAFYDTLATPDLSEDARAVQRQAFAGMLWSKQFYHYDVASLAPRRSARAPSLRRNVSRGRNSEWTHLFNADVISMPDKWEYPWYAAWDLAFHCIPLALVDAEFAKQQLVLLLREWYMHPNGQLPAYEWALSDVNPPVHAWAAWRVYKIDKKRTGRGDRKFLERVFHKLLLNFTWWINRKDAQGKNVFQGGFLGLDNIGVFDRSAPAADGRQHRAVGRDELDGHVLPQHADDRARARPGRRGLRGRRVQVLRALRLHLPGDEQPRRPGDRALESRGRLFLRRARPARRPAVPDEGPFDGRPDTALRRRDARLGSARPVAGLQAADAVVSREPSGLRAARRDRDRVRREGHAASSRSSTSSGSNRSAATCSTRPSFCRRTASAPCPGTIAGQPVRHRRRRPGASGRLRAGRVLDRASSAATRTGAARCGSR